MKRLRKVFMAYRMEFIFVKDLFNSEQNFPNADYKSWSKKKIFTFLNKDEVFEITGKKNTFFIEKVEARKDLIICKVAKERNIILPMKDKKHLVEHTQDIYPYIYFVYVPKQQILFIQKNRQVLHAPKVFIREFVYYLQMEIFNEKKITIEYDLIKEENAFWQTIKSNEDNINRIVLKMHAPNLFGFTHKKYKDLMDAVNKETNATQMAISLENESGKLKLPEKDPLTRDIASVIEKGGGDMYIKTLDGNTIRLSSKERKFYIDDILLSSVDSFIKAILKWVKE